MQNNNEQQTPSGAGSSVSKFDSELLSRSEAARYLGVTSQTLAIWKTTQRYNLPVVKIGRLAKYRLCRVRHNLYYPE